MPDDTDAERLAEARAWYAQRPDMKKEGVTPFLLRLLDEREADIAKLRDIIAAAYQVVGALAHYTGTFYNDDVIRALGAFSNPDGPANVDLLPWPKDEIITAAAQDAERLATERVPSGAAMDTARGIRCADDPKQPALGTWQLPLVAAALTAAAQAARNAALEEAAAACAPREMEAWSRDMLYGGEIIEARIRSLSTKGDGT